MSSRNWLEFAAAGMIAAILLLFAGAVLQSVERAQDSLRYEESAEAGNQYLTPRAGIPAIAERSISNPEPQSDSERQRRDLAAQESMSVWAFWLLLVSTVGTVVAMLGTAFLLWQIILTRRAVRGSSDATEAMVKANEIAAAGQRAWIDIRPKVTVRANSDGTVYLKTDAEHTNVGKSVATNVYTMCRFRTGTGSKITNEHNQIFRKMMRSGGGMSLMPGKHRSGGQTQSGFRERYVDWDESGRAFFCIIAIAIYSVEGDERRRYSRGMFYLRRADRAIPGIHEMTWDEFVGGQIEVDPLSFFDCS